jgi:hypothetical protein
MFDKSFLNRVQLSVIANAFNCQNVFASHFLDWGTTGSDRLFIDEDRTGTAKTLTTAKLRAGKAQVVAQHPQQHALVVDLHACRLAV